MMYCGGYPWETSVEDIMNIPEFLEKKEKIIMVTRDEGY
jgi:hypothetical protein